MHVYYSVSPIHDDIKHDAIWVDNQVYEVTNEGPLISTRNHQNPGELFFYLGETYHETIWFSFDELFQALLSCQVIPASVKQHQLNFALF